MKIIESPREGMQGYARIIPVGDKVRYIRKLMAVGFDTVETGSLVSARLIPQMADSLEVLEQLHRRPDTAYNGLSGKHQHPQAISGDDGHSHSLPGDLGEPGSASHPLPLPSSAPHESLGADDQDTPAKIPSGKGSKATLPKGAATARSNLMFLAVNGRGAEKLAPIEGITHISYPFSFTPTFLRLNVNSTVEESLSTTGQVVRLCRDNGKEAVIYISMAFGNPYGDPWSLDLLVDWVGKLYDAGARIIPLSNVTTEIDAGLIAKVFGTLIPTFPEIEFGLHLHTANQGWFEKVDAAWSAGCRRFDGVINGWGGCPMAGKEMLGNLMTETLIEFASQKGIPLGLDTEKLYDVYRIAREIFKT
jgi:hydroxymethylglutaryl-CoA lyase